MWLLQTVIIHLFFLGSIFIIYFRSPIIRGLQPQTDLLSPPAKRLVLFVTDGLRADSFFKDNCRYIPNIRTLFQQKGLVGVSHTRVPTESRPGHIALIAGLYEDPSAVTRGWKENPIDFDSVFNRSKITYAWGSYDILSIFSKCTDKHKINIYSYDHALDFSGKDKTFLLDTWVFEQVKSFIHNNSLNLKEETKIIFFLHLLGLDSAGHIHKPESSLFYENLQISDHGIFEIYKLFEDVFPDKRTAYVLTSDHGMTNEGSHGSSHNFETETPFFVWGSGINDWIFLQKDIVENLTRKCNVPLFETEQANFAPLMSSLIGVAAPMNNFGKVPIDFLNTTMKYRANALHNNVLQVIAQYEWLLKDFRSGYFSNFLPEYQKLTLKDIYEFRKLIFHKIEQLKFTEVIDVCNHVLKYSLEGIEYYHTYYKQALLLSTTLSFAGWMLNLFLILQNHTNKDKSGHRLYIWYIFAVVLIAFIYLQKIPLAVGIYLILPIICWSSVLKKDVKSLKFSMNNLGQIVVLIIGAEFLVLSFYKRELISLVFVISSVAQNYRILKKPFTTKQYQWIISLILLTTFPFYPSISAAKSDELIFLGALIWIAAGYFSGLYREKICFLISLITTVNLVICVTFYKNGLGIPTVSLLLNWILTVLSFLAPLLLEKNHDKRIRFIIHYLEGIYMLLSISYELLFVELLGMHLLLFSDLSARKKIQNDILNGRPSVQKINVEILITAFNAILFTMLSFFGTGNIASISSFDPNTVRYFVTTFSPFTIMGLIILKLVIPIILVISVLFKNIHDKVDQRNTFISLLLICEVMGLNFLFMVTNKGSWLEIGSSISHFVIMEFTTLFILIIYHISKWLINTNLFKIKDCISKRH